MTLERSVSGSSSMVGTLVQSFEASSRECRVAFQRPLVVTEQASPRSFHELGNDFRYSRCLRGSTPRSHRNSAVAAIALFGCRQNLSNLHFAWRQRESQHA